MTEWKIEYKALELIAKAADGDLRKAINLLEKVLVSAGFTVGS